MTRYRVMLPFKFETRTLRDEATITASGVTKSDGSATTCPGGTDGFIFSGDPGDVSAQTELFGWGDASDAYSQVTGAFAAASGSYSCVGSSFVVGTIREEQEYRWSLVDPDAVHAMPESWQSMIQTNGEMLALVTTQKGRLLDSLTGAGTTCNGVFYWNVGGSHVTYDTGVVTETKCRLLPSSGRVHVDGLGSVRFVGASGSPICVDLDVSSITNLRSITPIQTDALILTVPLTDPPDETP
jgi:hypothetical protein